MAVALSSPQEGIGMEFALHPWSWCYLPACMRTGSLPRRFRLMVMHILHRILSFGTRNSQLQPELPEPAAEQGWMSGMDGPGGPRPPRGDLAPARFGRIN